MVITLKTNPAELKSFLNAVGKIQPGPIVFDIVDGWLTCVCIDAQQNVSLYAKHELSDTPENYTFGLTTCGRLEKALEFVPQDAPFEMAITNDCLQYNGDAITFRTPLLNDRLIANVRCGLNPQKIESLGGDIIITLSPHEIQTLNKSRGFAVTSDTLQIAAGTHSTKQTAKFTCFNNGVGPQGGDSISFDLGYAQGTFESSYKISMDILTQMAIPPAKGQIILLINQQKRGMLFRIEGSPNTFNYGVRTLAK